MLDTTAAMPCGPHCCETLLCTVGHHCHYWTLTLDTMATLWHQVSSNFAYFLASLAFNSNFLVQMYLCTLATEGTGRFPFICHEENIQWEMLPTSHFPSRKEIWSMGSLNTFTYKTHGYINYVSLNTQMPKLKALSATKPTETLLKSQRKRYLFRFMII